MMLSMDFAKILKLSLHGSAAVNFLDKPVELW